MNNNVKLNFVGQAEAKFVTHSGVFHADEVLATVILGKIHGNLDICRTNRVESPRLDAVVYDIGGGRFDHHMPGGNGKRENGVPYSSAGLLWKEYGMLLTSGTCDPDYVWEIIDREIVQGVDAIDNGAMPRPDYPAQAMSLNGIVRLFNNPSTDESFAEAVSFVETIFDKLWKSAITKAEAKATVKEAIRKAKDGILVLQEYVPWQDPLFSSEEGDGINYVVYPSARGGWNWQCVPDAPGSFDQRKNVPESWKGLSGGSLQKELGVTDATFCHPKGFIGGAASFEGAYQIALKAQRA